MIKTFEEWKNPFKRDNIKTVQEYSDIVGDPYGEEDWDSDYDIFIDKPGLTAKHRKDGDVGAWQWNTNIPNFWLYVKEHNPGWDENNKNYYCGFLSGFILASEYYEKIHGLK